MNLNEKLCGHCGSLKLLSEFGVNRKSRDGRRGECRACHNIYNKQLLLKNPQYRESQQRNSRSWGKTHKLWKRQYIREYVATHSEQVRDYKRRMKWGKKFGLTEEQVGHMYEEQNGRCRICGRTEGESKQSFCIDHDHTTGIIRGLLCVRCNLGLGFVEHHFDKIMEHLERGK